MGIIEKILGKKSEQNRHCIRPGESMKGVMQIPLDSFPKEVIELLKDPVKNKDEIIRIVGEDGICVVVKMDFKDQFGKNYEQKWKVNIITGDVEEIEGDGLLRMTSKGIEFKET